MTNNITVNDDAISSNQVLERNTKSLQEREGNIGCPKIECFCFCILSSPSTQAMCYISVSALRYVRTCIQLVEGVCKVGSCTHSLSTHSNTPWHIVTPLVVFCIQFEEITTLFLTSWLEGKQYRNHPVSVITSVIKYCCCYYLWLVCELWSVVPSLSRSL